MISSVSEMYPTAVICLLWARDSFCVARRWRLPCHNSKMSWTLAILCNFCTYTSFIISESFSVFVMSDSESSPPKIPIVARANCLPTMFSRSVLPVVSDCLQPITSHTREKLGTTPTPCGMIKKIPRATLDRSVNFECVS